jgi:hypothetical protein
MFISRPYAKVGRPFQHFNSFWEVDSARWPISYDMWKGLWMLQMSWLWIIMCLKWQNWPLDRSVILNNRWPALLGRCISPNHKWWQKGLRIEISLSQWDVLGGTRLFCWGEGKGSVLKCPHNVPKCVLTRFPFLIPKFSRVPQPIPKSSTTLHANIVAQKFCPINYI